MEQSPDLKYTENKDCDQADMDEKKIDEFPIKKKQGKGVKISTAKFKGSSSEITKMWSMDSANNED